MTLVAWWVGCTHAVPTGEPGAGSRVTALSSSAGNDGGYGAPAPVVLVEEIASRVEGGPDWVELANSSRRAVSLDGARLTADGEPYDLPDGFSVPAGGRVVVTFGGDGAGLDAPFRLPGDGILTLAVPGFGDTAVTYTDPPDAFVHAKIGGRWVVVPVGSPGWPNGTLATLSAVETWAADGEFRSVATVGCEGSEETRVLARFAGIEAAGWTQLEVRADVAGCVALAIGADVAGAPDVGAVARGRVVCLDPATPTRLPIRPEVVLDGELAAVFAPLTPCSAGQPVPLRLEDLALVQIGG